MKRIAIVSLNQFPLRHLCALYYWLAYQSVVLLFSWRHSDVLLWVRNSYATNELVFGMSDIDFTVIYENDVSRDSCQNSLKMLKVLFPVIGECNYYKKAYLKTHAYFMNSFELMRDPKLKTFFNRTSVEDDKQKTVFLLRQFENDIKNLKHNPEFRIPKWQRIQKLVGLQFEMTSFASIRSLLTQRLGYEVRDISPDLVVFPHLWLAHNWHRMEDAKTEISRLNDNLRSVLKTQLFWEVSGILTQLGLIETQNIKMHLQNVRILLMACTDDDAVKKLDEVLATL